MGVSQSVLGVGALEKHVPRGNHPPKHSKAEAYHEANESLHELFHQAELGLDGLSANPQDPVGQYVNNMQVPSALVADASALAFDPSGMSTLP